MDLINKPLIQYVDIINATCFQAESLNAQLIKWLNDAQSGADVDFAFPVKGSKAIIAPHAGYSYSGPAAAWAYKSIDNTGIKRVFILGPSHHVYLDGCALSQCREYSTPIGNLPLDIETIAELRKTGAFQDMSLETDEDEHSIEMHLPYVRKVFEGIDIKIIPILVGAISNGSEQTFGKLLSPYLSRTDTFCVVSSDFCHWGTRFQYTFYYPSPPDSSGTVGASGVRLSRSNASASISSNFQIYESITALDHQAMDILTLPTSTAKEAHGSFTAYLSRTKNTICGRHPIGVLLGALTIIEGRSDGGGGDGASPREVTIKFERLRHNLLRYEEMRLYRNLCSILGILATTATLRQLVLAANSFASSNLYYAAGLLQAIERRLFSTLSSAFVGTAITAYPVLEPDEIGVSNDTVLEFLDDFKLSSKDHGIKGQEFIEAHQGWQCERANTIKGELDFNSGILVTTGGGSFLHESVQHSLTGLRVMHSTSPPFTLMVSGILTPRRSEV
ncbi:UPF0103-domain-containing protein [Sanghuangporus baumii]|uniref:UPF0103-domain-containing protein n=1 Tax=Sanghuangporus baumii TaxID=108892 RepID=A0A9Q5NDR6_SANBA|nr:UPF0103-domain-containing protein [Sanghuangporus baumii]